MSGGISQSYLYLGVILIPVSRRGWGGSHIKVLRYFCRGGKGYFSYQCLEVFLSSTCVWGYFLYLCRGGGGYTFYTNVWRYFYCTCIRGHFSYRCRGRVEAFLTPVSGGISVVPVSGGISHTCVEEGKWVYFSYQCLEIFLLYLYQGVFLIPVSRRRGVLIPMSVGTSFIPVSRGISHTCVEEGGISRTCVEEGKGGIFLIPMSGGISVVSISGDISHTCVEEG